MTRLVYPSTFLVMILAAPAAAQGIAPTLVAEPARAEPHPGHVRGATASAAATGTFEYLYDDGAGNVNIGPPSTFDPDMLWGNYFFSEPAGQVITEIAVAFGPTFPSSSTGPVTFWLLDDPDADGDPRNATALTSVDATPDVFGNTFYEVAIPPTTVSGAFFVGASALLLGGQDRPARVDTDGRADRSWFFYAPDIAAVIDSLAGAPFGTRMDDQTNVPFPGAFMVRATGDPITSVPEEPAQSVDIIAVPNPTTAGVDLRFDLPRSESVMLDVLDGAGRRVAVLVDGVLSAGPHAIRWDARSVAPGVYVARILAGGTVQRATVAVAR